MFLDDALLGDLVNDDLKNVRNLSPGLDLQKVRSLSGGASNQLFLIYVGLKTDFCRISF